MTKEELQRRMFADNLFGLHETIEPLTRTSIGLNVTDLEQEPAVGTTKIGGQPDLPPDIEWPLGHSKSSLKDILLPQKQVPMSFIAQINLRDIKHLDETGLLPDSGMLYFFYSSQQAVWGLEADDKEDFAVKYFDGDVKELQRREFPDALAKSARFKAVGILPTHEVSIPSWERKLFGDPSDDDLDRLLEITAEFLPNKMLGYADNIQGVMEEDCELLSRKAFGKSPPNSAELSNSPDEWVLLLQVDSIEECGMMWGDVGMLYFWIRKGDLLQKRFDQCWFQLQCY